jgi:hypothetical protein
VSHPRVAARRAAVRVRVLAALAGASGPLDYREVCWAMAWTSSGECVRDRLDELVADGAVVRTTGRRTCRVGSGSKVATYETPVYALAGR